MRASACNRFYAIGREWHQIAGLQSDRPSFRCGLNHVTAIANHMIAATLSLIREIELSFHKIKAVRCC